MYASYSLLTKGIPPPTQFAAALFFSSTHITLSLVCVNIKVYPVKIDEISMHVVQ